MGPVYRLVGFAILLGAGHAAELPATNDPQAILMRIRDKVATRLALLPNYTCHEVIDRSVHSLSGSSTSHDRVELEVAFVGQRELFGRPGDTNIREESITKLVTDGTIGDGIFGSQAENIFLEGVASFYYIGVFEKDGHRAYRYDFQVPLEKSGFTVKHNSAEATVPYHGSFWADVNTFDLVRLETVADQIPSLTAISFVKEEVEYTTLAVGNSEFLLPLHAEMEGRDSSGNLSQNEVTLAQCREFTGKATVTFGQPVNGSPTARPAPEQ